MINSPCKDCPDRELGCPTKCEKWHEYTKERNSIYEARVSQREMYNALYDIRGHHGKKIRKEILHRRKNKSN